MGVGEAQPANKTKEKSTNRALSTLPYPFPPVPCPLSFPYQRHEPSVNESKLISLLPAGGFSTCHIFLTAFVAQLQNLQRLFARTHAPLACTPRTPPQTGNPKRRREFPPVSVSRRTRRRRKTLSQSHTHHPISSQPVSVVALLAVSSGAHTSSMGSSMGHAQRPNLASA